MGEKVYDCMHEELLQNHSLQINDLKNELGYKKERLDDLKEDNRRMEEKIDEIKDCVNQIIIASKDGDNELEARLIAIETEQKNLNQKIDDNKKDHDKEIDQRFTRIGLILTGISVAIGIIFHFI